MAVATFAAIAGMTARMATVRAWGARARRFGLGVLGGTASLIVFLLQSVSVGASLGGAVVALAAGGVTVLVLALVRGA